MGTLNGTQTSGAGRRPKQKFHEMMFFSLTHKGSSPCGSGEQTIAGFNFILFIELTTLVFLITPTIGSMTSLSWARCGTSPPIYPFKDRERAYLPGQWLVLFTSRKSFWFRCEREDRKGAE